MKTKRIGIIFMIAVLLITSMAINVTFAEDKPEVDLVSEEKKDDDVVVVTAKIIENTGIAGFKFKLEYNSEQFAIAEIEMNPYFEENGIVANNDATEGNLILSWASDKNFTDDDELFKIYFNAINGIPDAYAFNLTCEEKNIVSEDLENVPITIGNAANVNATPVPPTPTPDPLAVNVANPFNDVKSDAWFYPYVMFTYANKLFMGMSEDSFGPDLKMTRAMFVTVLHRLVGDKAASPSSAGSFSDVPMDSWYGPAVYWAAGQKLVTGTSDGIFSPEEIISREQMMVIIYNLYKGEPVTYNLTFSDAAMISSWAKDAVRFCVSKNIISGREDNTLAPTEGLTRAEASKMFFVISTTLNNEAEPTATPEQP